MYTAATGISPPMPMPCTKRRAISQGSEPAPAHRRLMIDMSAVAPAAARIRPQRSAILPNTRAPMS
jgi:hypothetical protein